jgi:hypothetical protein
VRPGWRLMAHTRRRSVQHSRRERSRPHIHTHTQQPTCTAAADSSDEGWLDGDPHGQVRAADLGAVTSVTIGHDNSGRAPSWHLNRVLVTAPGAKEPVCFPCGRCVRFRAAIRMR